MPPTTNSAASTEAKKTPKPKDPDSKPDSKADSKADSKKPIPQESDVTISESGAPLEGGENAVLAKPPKPRKPKTAKPPSTIADTVPKKNAQRAKGSISLNKTMEQADPVNKFDSRVSISSTDKLPKGDGSLKKLKSAEEPKTPTAAQKRRKKKEPAEKEKPAEKTLEEEVEEEKPVPKVLEVEPCSRESLEEKTLGVVNQEVEAKFEDISPSFNSCSFFEKLQQGVKAYFSSRSSFNPEDRNKKEGGIRTRGRVEKGVNKEDSKKRKPGIKIKKTNAELAQRVKGGQSSTFVTGRPKIFRKLKRKKLYHPKKYYVRIQIPRQEYFYRSTIGLQNRVLPAIQRMEHQKKKKAEEKTDTADMAPKRAKTNGVRPLTAEEEQRWRERLQRGESAERFEERVNEHIATNWPVLSEAEQPAGEMWTAAEKAEDTWVGLLGSAMGGEQFVYNLEMGEVSPDACFAEEPQPQEASTALCHPGSSAASLMGGIDLHLELQNYLKAIEGFHSTKSRTKNTLQCNYYDNYIPIKIYSSSQDIQNGAEDFFDVGENKSTSSFDSAASDCSQLEKTPNEVLLNVTEDPKPIEEKPETEKPEDKSSGKQLSETDVYEKIQPYRTNSAPRCRKKAYLLKSCLSVEQHQTLTQPQPREEENGGRWSPTLQDLIDVYNSVLKQSKKLQRSTDTGKRRSSPQLFAYLVDKLKEKRYKTELINLSKDIRDSSRPNNFQKMKKTNANVEEYVAMFQEILNSSLTIDQIARLNNQIADLYNISEKNYARMQEETESQKQSSIELKPKDKTTTVKKTVTFEEPPEIRKTSKPKAKPLKVGETKKVEITPSIELESMLKLHFGGEEVVSKKEKMLVTVKLSGNHILVNDLTYFHNENALSSEKTRKDDTSELIIENVTKAKDIWYKNTKSSELRFLRSPPKQEKVKTPVKKPAKQKTKKPRKPAKPTDKKPPTEKPKEVLMTVPFEYDEKQLKAQHPMEAIMETSESKLSNRSEPPPETKILLQDIPTDAAAMKEMLKAALKGRTHSKHLTCDFGWSEEEIGRKFLGGTKPQAKRRPTPKKKKKAATVRSMVDLKKGQKTHKAAPLPPCRSYMCYSAVQSVQSGKKSGLSCWSSESNAPHKIKSRTGNVSKKASKDGGLKRKKIDATPSKSAATENTPTTEPQPEEALDPVEVLFPENTEAPKVVVEVPSVTSQEDKAKIIPIAFLSEAANTDGTSFLAEMIHSDSFLANMSQSKLKTLDRCCSDIKFYPGRLTESGNEPTPLVKFVLTPSQIEQANLPPNQVEVVNKKDNTAVSKEAEDQEDDREKSLKSIEEFIKYLSKCRKLASRKKKPKESRKTETKAPSTGKAVASIPCNRKPLRECQKRKATAKDKRQKTKELKAPTNVVPDLILNKMVRNLSKALKTFKNDRKPEPKRKVSSAGDLDRQKKKEKTKEKKPTTAADVSQELETAVKKAIARAVARAISRAYASPAKEAAPLQETKAEELDSGDARQEEKPSGDIDLLDSLVFRDTEGADLKKRNSTYFDAVDISGKGDDTVDDSERIKAEGDNQHTELVLKEITESHCHLTASDEELFASNKSEEIFDKISKSLEEGRISYSMALLDGFLNKSENSDCDKLRKLLALVENKSTSIMKNMETAAWLKVLWLLEEATQVFENKQGDDCRKTQLKTAKHFIDKIQSLNIRRLVDLQNFFSSLSQTPSRDVPRGGIFVRLKDSLYSMIRFVLSQTTQQQCDRPLETASAIRIHSTVSLPEIKEESVREAKRLEEERQARELRGKLRQQYICLEQLMNCERDECDQVPAEIRDVKRKVAEKMKMLEKAFHSLEEQPQQGQTSWTRATSLLSVANSFRSEEPSTSAEDARLCRSPGYVDLMKGLLKAWDTRTTLNCITRERFA